MSQHNVANETTETPDLMNATEYSNSTDILTGPQVMSIPDYNTLWENLTQNLKTDPDIMYQREFLPGYLSILQSIIYT